MFSVPCPCGRQRKTEKARKWFNRAVTLDPDNGDSHAAYYKFELKSGTAERVRREATVVLSR